VEYPRWRAAVRSTDPGTILYSDDHQVIAAPAELVVPARQRAAMTSGRVPGEGG
jgi:hypothetical protein